MELTHIRAIYTPDTPQPDSAETGKDVAEPEPVDIVALLTDDYGASVVIFIDYDGNLRRGFLRQFSNCVIVTQ